MLFLFPPWYLPLCPAPVTAQSQNVSCVAVSQRGACGHGERSRSPVQGSSRLSGVRLRGHGKVLTITPASSSFSSSSSASSSERTQLGCVFWRLLARLNSSLFAPPQECIHRCRSDLTAETPVVPGSAHLQLQPQTEALSFGLPPSSQSKRSYSMEHFRWGKPAGRKRRPVKVFTSNSLEDDSTELFPGEMRRELPGELLAAAQQEESELEMMEEAEEEEEEQQQQRHLLANPQKKKDGSYKMKHFRWSGPPASKRYGGFMKNWDEGSPRPLLTLLKNVINKDREQQK